MIDQPTIVKNPTGQRPVENIVSSPVSLRYGGMQPANTSKSKMFGNDAPIWGFLERFNRPGVSSSEVWETYPVLTMIALGGVLHDTKRSTGRLPKYNPRNKKFSINDWRHVCKQLPQMLTSTRFPQLNAWSNEKEAAPHPSKEDQDKIDACICLIVALHFVEKKCLAVGNSATGCIVVPHNTELHKELGIRCEKTSRVPLDWIKIISWKHS